MTVSEFYTYTFVVFDEIAYEWVQGSYVAFEIKIFDEDFEKVPGDKRSYTIVAEDLERSGIFDDNDSDIVHDSTRKVLSLLDIVLKPPLT